LWKTFVSALFLHFVLKKMIGHGAAFGDFAHCGERPETLSLDSAAFEKAGETFTCAPR